MNPETPGFSLTTFSKDTDASFTKRVSTWQGELRCPTQADETGCIATHPDPVPLKPPQILEVDVRGRSAVALHQGVERHLQSRLDHVQEAGRKDHVGGTFMDQQCCPTHFIASISIERCEYV